MRDRIGEGRGEAKKRKKPHMSCRCDMGNGVNSGGKRKKRKQESVGSVSLPTSRIWRIARKQGGKCKALSA